MGLERSPRKFFKKLSRLNDYFEIFFTEKVDQNKIINDVAPTNSRQSYTFFGRGWQVRFLRGTAFPGSSFFRPRMRASAALALDFQNTRNRSSYYHISHPVALENPRIFS